MIKKITNEIYVVNDIAITFIPLNEKHYVMHLHVNREEAFYIDIKFDKLEKYLILLEQTLPIIPHCFGRCSGKLDLGEFYITHRFVKLNSELFKYLPNWLQEEIIIYKLRE